MKGCVIFERTLLSRKKSHNLAWSCAISNMFYSALANEFVTNADSNVEYGLNGMIPIRKKKATLLLIYVYPLIWIFKRLWCLKWFWQNFCHKKAGSLGPFWSYVCFRFLFRGRHCTIFHMFPKVQNSPQHLYSKEANLCSTLSLTNKSL